MVKMSVSLRLAEADVMGCAHVMGKACLGYPRHQRSIAGTCKDLVSIDVRVGHCGDLPTNSRTPSPHITPHCPPPPLLDTRESYFLPAFDLLIASVISLTDCLPMRRYYCLLFNPMVTKSWIEMRWCSVQFHCCGPMLVDRQSIFILTSECFSFVGRESPTSPTMSS